MSWLIEQEMSQTELSKKMKAFINEQEILKLPGTHDAMAALIAKKIGFKALYLSGAAYTASRGLPDIGIVTSTEVAERARELVRTTNLPILVDIDTGFGEVINVARTAKEMVEAKVAAVQIEDQVLPKKCGHLNGKKLVSPDEMVQKIKMIKTAAPTLLVVARTDAKSVEGLDSALKRANAYVEAGADAIFPEALSSEEEFIKASKWIKAPLLANMTEFGKTPYYSANQFSEMGYNMVIYPVTSLRVAAKAYEKVFTEIFDTGTQEASLDEMQTRKELYKTIGYYEYEQLDQNIAKTKLPNIGEK
ncbi:methylisocitrate lyase [Chengkuizengella sp. 2205SS18-9]|uniref:Methylisocitrate lyase n=2 Tax=Chengkuizengella axinellae TaxID=3064388 RepID=A0ABT9ITP5_9BACL|nr:methylisocitrate lyase [Chengkuizengella sp. 2205SS18-9]MDP5272721.1 methylisocitrate lyase [Chengkuizengella sp. 2205SS18-9]